MKIHRMQLLISAFVLAASTALVAANETAASSAQAQATPAPPEGAADGRFEGYLWLDADGHPLPFQTDEAIEDFLETSAIVTMKEMPVGVTNPKKVLLAGDGVRVHAVFKTVDEKKRDIIEKTAGQRRSYREWRDWHLYDAAAYHVDRLLGMDRVPPAIPRKIRRANGTLKIWLENTITDTMRRDQEIKPPDLVRFNQQRQIMHIFDNLVANRDSNLGNTLIDRNWRLWFIDCGRCFGTSKGLLYPEAITHCERDLWRALKALDEAQLRASLGSFLSVYEIDALLIRRDKLVAHIQALIDEWGEVHVLFDLTPPGERASWGDD